MSRAARSIVAFGFYLVATAALLIVAPNTLLGLVQIAPTTDPWIRVVGVLVGALSVYYIAAARAEFVPFFRASIWVRFAVLLAFTGLAGLGLAPAMLVGFGVVDAAGALWTWVALRSDRRAA